MCHLCACFDAIIIKISIFILQKIQGFGHGGYFGQMGLKSKRLPKRRRQIKSAL